ncbi:glycosyltransferase family 4 protein [Massilia sp. Se16.2.3]|uniref:glycosyltransferase family 4 protein n=1 Tax=Massilia sp. Se16.2.3 TaxID=2709303 RepID=UPI001E283ACE|nr:glycosyltransferase family 4 protein [Massilia sp. Se16.2.3]
MRTRSLSIAYIVRDPLPPLRADVLTLFGAEMPRHGVHTELVGQRGAAPGAPWQGGGMHAVGSLAGRFASILAPLWDALGLLRAARRVRPDCIQVRDKVASAWLGLVAARLLRVPFVYWMSFPIVEGFEARRDALRGRGRGPAWLGHAVRPGLAPAAVPDGVAPRQPPVRAERGDARLARRAGHRA